MSAEVLVTSPRMPLPTVPGKVAGIVAIEPLTVQCADCGRTASAPEAKNPAWTLVVLAGWQFHGCEGRTGKRRCPDCLEAAKVACESRRCKE